MVRQWPPLYRAPGRKHGRGTIAFGISGLLGGAGDTDVIAFIFTAPVLAFVSATDPDSDNTQDLEADFSEDIEGYVVRLVGTFGSATVSEPYDVDSSNTIDAGEAAALEAAFTTGAIDDGVCSFKCRIENGSGTALSAWSNTVSKTITTAAAGGTTYYWLGF